MPGGSEAAATGASRYRAGMAVLVDQAIWEWRGRQWAHLVSDESYDELHAFGQRIGKRRLGFQGDHYDVDELDRERAVALGAVPVDARELLGRLRRAGLRRRDHKPTWQRLAIAEAGESLRVADHPRLRTVAEQLHELDRVARSALFADQTQAVLLFDWHGERVSPAGIDVDEVWAGEPRADGERSLELFAAR